jgi:hypothetical protein
MIKKIFFVFLALFFCILLSSFHNKAIAACTEDDPEWCENNGDCALADHCSGGKCCIPDTGSGGGSGSCVRACSGTQCNKTPTGCSPVTSSSCNTDADCVDGGGPGPTPTPTPTPASCTASLSPNPAAILQDATQAFTATPVPQNGSVSEVRFTSSNTGIATISPASDASSPYNATATGISGGTSTIAANVYMGGTLRCAATSALTVAFSPAWFQTLGGDTWASIGIESIIPINTCILPGCNPALMLRDPLGTTDSAGFPLSDTGSIVTSAGGGVYIHEASGRSNAVQANALGVNVPTENYEYFYNKFGALAQALPNASKPIVGSTLVVYGYTGDLTLTENNPWNLANTEKIIVFVSGNLNLDDTAVSENRITSVAIGGDAFLMFIVSGNITVTGNVGYIDPTTDPTQANIANIEGVFIADGIFTIATTNLGDRKFIGAGTFVGWGGVDLQRDYDDGNSPELNGDAPTEVFIFRPDFIINAPRPIKSAQMTWREIEPRF